MGLLGSLHTALQRLQVHHQRRRQGPSIASDMHNTEHQTPATIVMASAPGNGARGVPMLVLHDHAPAMQGCIRPKPRLVRCGLFIPSLHIHPARFCLVSSIGVCFSAFDVGCGPSCWPRCIMSVISGISRGLGEVRSCRAGEGLKMPVQCCWKEVAESRPEAPLSEGTYCQAVRHRVLGWRLEDRRTPPELLAPATNASMSSRLFFLCPLAIAPLSRNGPIRHHQKWEQLGPLWSWLGAGGCRIVTS